MFARMKQVYDFYREEAAAYRRRAAGLGKRIHTLGTARLLLVAGWLVTLWLLWADAWTTLALVTLPFALLFALLMAGHHRLFARKQYAEGAATLYGNELKGLDYDFSAFDGAAEKSDGEHPFAPDLDLFGDHSLFQAINRTVTTAGRDRLAAWFLHPLTDKEAICKRQEAVRELAALPALRRHFLVTGSCRTAAANDRRQLEQLLAEKVPFSYPRCWQWLSWLVPAGWAALAIGSLTGVVADALLQFYLLVAIVIAYAKSGAINRSYRTVNKLERLFLVYADLMKCLEEAAPFRSEALQTIRGALTGKRGSASAALRRLSRHIGALDSRFSLGGLLFNILYLRDTRQVLLLERWKEEHAAEAGAWLDAVVQFDAYASLAGFAFNHPDYCYPEMADHYFQMQGKALGHPLIDRRRCVRNDIDIPSNPAFLIITGANMAGKSTYLRTVGVNYLLACVGAPACAESLTLYPARLVTSLRTTDSLASNESYFFAELKRLKMIISRLEQGERLFIILDEILKGTNSVDKQKGSLALVKQLVGFGSCGIIATHDLVLGTLAEEFPGIVRNYCFEADIRDEELTFSYRMREGVARNMNACFLMRKMGIGV